MGTVRHEANATEEAQVAGAGGSLDHIPNSVGLAPAAGHGDSHAESAEGADSSDARSKDDGRPGAEGQYVEGLRHRVGELEAAAGRYQAEIDGLQEKLSATVPKYRQALLEAAPGLPAELVVGNSIEELDRAVAIAKEVVAKVRHQLAEQAAEDRVPPGAPGRVQPDLSRLSPREKIKAGLTRG